MASRSPHRRIQDFVRGGGGARPSWPPGGGKALLAPPGSAPDYLGKQFCGGGGGGGARGPGSAPAPGDPKFDANPTIIFRVIYSNGLRRSKRLSHRTPCSSMEMGLCLAIFFSQERLKAFNFFSPQDRLKIFISMFILYLFQPPVWIKYLFPPCLAIYFFHPFFLQKYLFPKRTPPPQSQYSNGGSLRVDS